MKQGTIFWLNILANFRKGELLLDIVKETEPFLRYPKVFSPLAENSYRRYTTFEIPGIQKLPSTFRGVEEFPWDGVLIDQSTRKFLLLAAFSSPEEITAGNGCSDMETEALIRDAFSAYRSKGDVSCWLTDYFRIAFPMALVQSLNDPCNGCLEGGYRAELFLLFLADDYTSTPVSIGSWEEFEREMWQRMMGEEGQAPRAVFPSVFSVGEPSVEEHHNTAQTSDRMDFGNLAFLGIHKHNE